MSFNFALLLVILCILSGTIFLIDWLFLAKKRSADQSPARVVEYARSFFPIFLTVLLLRTFLIEPFRIPSGSLEPTLLVGDFVAVNKFIYGLRLPVLETKILPISAPKRGDVVVFRWPVDPSFDYIKRVVGIPGDHISSHNKILTINGKKIPQEFVEYTLDASSGKPVAKYKENLLGVVHDIYVRPEEKTTDFDITIPPGKYFMLGDNRDDSADSRYWGLVEEKYLRGKAFAVWMSWNGNTDVVRWARIGKIVR